jgi:hypothetical protein
MLIDYQLEPQQIQQPFTSQHQGLTANCGYLSVYNALVMLEITPPQINIIEFITEQMRYLEGQFGKIIEPTTEVMEKDKKNTEHRALDSETSSPKTEEGIFAQPPKSVRF